MTGQDIVNIISRITVPVGWHIITSCGYTEVQGKIVHSTIDSNNPSKPIIIYSSFYMVAHDGITEEIVLHTFKQAWLDHWKHEALEWLRYDGKLVDDPHAKDRVA